MKKLFVYIPTDMAEDYRKTVLDGLQKALKNYASLNTEQPHGFGFNIFAGTTEEIITAYEAFKTSNPQAVEGFRFC